MGFYVLESRAEPVTPAAASELHKNCVMLVVDDRIGASAGCVEVDGEVREWLREAAEAEVSAAALRVLWAMCLAYDAACLPFGMVGELRRKLSPIALAVLLLFMGVGIMNIRVSAEFPCLRQRAAFCFGRRPEENSASAVAAQERLKVRSSFRRFLYSFPLRRTLYFPARWAGQPDTPIYIG